MSVAVEELATSTGDPTDRVHHHTTGRHVAAGLRGEPIPMMCGAVRAGGPKGWDLPCCPMCSQLLEASGLACEVER